MAGVFRVLIRFAINMSHHHLCIVLGKVKYMYLTAIPLMLLN